MKILVKLLPAIALIAILIPSFTGCTTGPTQSREQAYQASVNAIVDRFYNHRKEYNTGLESVGALVRSARTESEQRQALQQAIAHLENVRQWFRQDMNDFAGVLPPQKFQDFHLLMNSVLRDYVEAIAAFITYYSQNLNLGTQDLQLTNRA
ncbi:MAG: hypothetical protein HW402_1155, partial [Dehalococcoidales bacterium]|nr:hypothetical protein [Dehalococcoidales bacterium]